MTNNRSRLSFQDLVNTVEVFVGRSGTRFLIHRELLTYHSEFFAAAFRGAFVENRKQSLKLPEDRADIFGLFVEWLYTQTLNPAAFLQDNKPAFFLLLELYALADRLSVEVLRDSIVDTIAALADRANSVPTPTDTHILYEQIRESAPVRALVLDLFAFKKTDNLLASHPDDWHPLFLRDLVVKLKRLHAAAGTPRHRLAPRASPAAVPAAVITAAPNMATRALATTTATTALRSCSICRSALRDGVGVHRCDDCAKSFCGACVGLAERVGDAGGVAEGSGAAAGEVVSCKPWKSDKCRYHEHAASRDCAAAADAKA